MMKPEEVQLFLARAPSQREFGELSFDMLAEAERQRAARFVREEKRQSFLASRLMLRRILARVLDAEPSNLNFANGEHGKPYLSGRYSGRLHFNLSHSANRILVGVSDAPLGVDIERMRDNLDYLRFARRFFSETEQAELAGCDEEHMPHAFFNGWTRKEAFLKAKGCGLTLGLDKFDVHLMAADEALAETRYDMTDRENWSLRGIDVGDGYKAAVARKGSWARLSLMDFVIW